MSQSLHGLCFLGFRKKESIPLGDREDLPALLPSPTPNETALVPSSPDTYCRGVPLFVGCSHGRNFYFHPSNHFLFFRTFLKLQDPRCLCWRVRLADPIYFLKGGASPPPLVTQVRRSCVSSPPFFSHRKNVEFVDFGTKNWPHSFFSSVEEHTPPEIYDSPFVRRSLVAAGLYGPPLCR